MGRGAVNGPVAAARVSHSATDIKTARGYLRNRIGVVSRPGCRRQRTRRCHVEAVDGATVALLVGAVVIETQTEVQR